MDGYSSKRGVATSRAPRKGYNAGSRDAKSAQDESVQFCNRIGCNGRIKYGNQNIKTGSSEIAKSSESSFSSLNGKGVIETSSRSACVMARSKSSCLDSKKKLSPQLGFEQSESSQSGISEATKSMCPPGRSPISYHSGSINKSDQVPAVKAGSALPSSVRARKENQSTSGSNKQNTRTTSALSSTSENHGLGTLHSSNRSMCLKDPKYNSISDSAPPNCSSSGSKSHSKHVMKKQSLEGAGSVYGRGKQATFGGHVSSTSGGASTSDYRRSSCISGADNSVSASVRTSGSADVNKSRMRLSYRQNGTNTSCIRESAVRISQYPAGETSRNVGRPRLLQSHSANASTSGSSSYSLSSSNAGSQSTWMPYTSGEHGYSRLVNRGMLQRYSMDIAEVLLALDRIEQEEGTTHEILALENSLYLGGLNLYDRHRDMRLDIDDMSYEELLALGDKMGTVSTALSEEELLKFVKRRIYKVIPPVTEVGEDGDDVKCCICQEDYVKGDEIGELVECQHVYHVGCVNQWLRLKNWCPICKTPAAPQQSS